MSFNISFSLLWMKVYVWWRTGVPMRVGMFEPGTKQVGELFPIGMFEGDTIWLDRTLMGDPATLQGVVEHESLHARCALLGRAARVAALLERAGASAYAMLVLDADLRTLLESYERANLNTREEALVIAVERGWDGGCSEIDRAARMLKRSGGWNPFNFLRIAIWLPVVAWTRRA